MFYSMLQICCTDISTRLADRLSIYRLEGPSYPTECPESKRGTASAD